MTDDTPSLKYNVYDPKDLTVEQLLKVLHLDDRHRIVDTGEEAIIIDWEKFLEDDKVKTVEPT